MNNDPLERLSELDNEKAALVAAIKEQHPATLARLASECKVLGTIPRRRLIELGIIDYHGDDGKPARRKKTKGAAPQNGAEGGQ